MAGDRAALLRVFAVWMLGISLAGCGSESDSTPGSGGAAKDGGANKDGGGGTSGVAGGGSGALSGSGEKSAWITASQIKDDAGAWSASLSAAVEEKYFGPCYPAGQAGACAIYDCTPRDAGTDLAVSAGTVTLSGGLQPFSATWGYDSYNDGQLTQQLWNEGDTLTFSAPGDVAPAFSDSVVAPGLVQLTAPSAGPTPLTIDRSKDLSISWTGATSGTVRARIGQGVAGAICEYPAAAQSGVIPAAALQNFPAGDGYFNFENINTKQLSVDAWKIELRLWWVAKYLDATYQ